MDDATPKTQSESASAAQDELLAEREKFLARELRDVCVEDEVSGKMKERNPKQSAEIIHQLGRVYRERSPDKIAIIKSAALFNAAIVRKPDNLDQVRTDLNELCAYALLFADAENKNADFVQQAASVFKQVEEMRSMVKTELDKIGFLSTGLDFMEKTQKSDQIEELQEKLSQVYIKIMCEIMEYCIKVKGPAPCQYALIGMGSLARKEITPYSDFESAVLLENGIETKENYEETLEYFRWVAVFFQLVMVNFGETIIRFVAIPSLNNPCNKDEDWFYDAFTPCGICPDGLAPQASKNPLGRQDLTENKPWTTELIKPVSEMLKYLDHEEDVKNGYHLADILTKTCFISGEENLHRLFTGSVKTKLVGQKLSAGFVRHVKANQLTFNATDCCIKFLFTDTFDVKRTIYRSITLFLAVVARLYEVEWSSSFNIIDKMKERFRDFEWFWDCIRSSLGTALEARLRVYTKNGSQMDRVEITAHLNAAQDMHPINEALGGMGLAEFIFPILVLQGFVLSCLEEAEESEARTRVSAVGSSQASTNEETALIDNDKSKRPQTSKSDKLTYDALGMTSVSSDPESDGSFADLLSGVLDFFYQIKSDRKLNSRSAKRNMKPFLQILDMSVDMRSRLWKTVQTFFVPGDDHEHSLAVQMYDTPPNTSRNIDNMGKQLRPLVRPDSLNDFRTFLACLKVVIQPVETNSNTVRLAKKNLEDDSGPTGSKTVVSGDVATFFRVLGTDNVCGDGVSDIVVDLAEKNYKKALWGVGRTAASRIQAACSAKINETTQADSDEVTQDDLD